MDSICSLQPVLLPAVEESARVAHLMDEQEKRDKTIADLKRNNETLKVTAAYVSPTLCIENTNELDQFIQGSSSIPIYGIFFCPPVHWK